LKGQRLAQDAANKVSKEPQIQKEPETKVQENTPTVETAPVEEKIEILYGDK
jgi:hypothetical protein